MPFRGADIRDATTMAKWLTARRIAILVAAVLLGGCTAKTSTDLRPDPRIWLIESYDHGTVTAKNDHKTYKATCEGHRQLGPDQFVYDTTPSFPCRMAIDAVGTNVEPIAPDTDFHRPFLVMGRGPGGSLVLRRQDNIETFAVTTVTKDPQ
jgi:hypothetical protein